MAVSTACAAQWSEPMAAAFVAMLHLLEGRMSPLVHPGQGSIDRGVVKGELTGLTKKKVFAQVRDAVDELETSTDDLVRLAAARTLRQLAEQVEREVVDDARAAGVRWIDIGEVYGTSKQSVQQRFTTRRPAATES